MIDITTTAMTSTISPEYAIREHRGSEAVWRLSWLPTHRLTHEQARAGMELDEILSDPAVVYDEAAHLWAADLATRVGIGVERVTPARATPGRTDVPPGHPPRDRRGGRTTRIDPRRMGSHRAPSFDDRRPLSPPVGLTDLTRTTIRRTRSVPMRRRAAAPARSVAGIGCQARVLCSAPTASARVV